MAKLTEQNVKALRRPPKGYVIAYDDPDDDGVAGFGVRVTAAGAKSLVLRYRFDDPGDFARRRSEYLYTIGAFGPNAWTVAAARAEAKRWRREIDKGTGHPMADRRGRRDAVKATREAETFKEAFEDYVTREQEGRRQNKTAAEIKRAVLKACAEWHDLPLASIAPPDIWKLLEIVRDGDKGKGEPPKPYLANRLYAYLRTFFGWCENPVIGKRVPSPMAGFNRPFEGEESVDRYFKDDELRKLWRAGDEIGGTSGAFLKIILLTGKRKSAVAAIRWEEIADDGFWTPPQPARRKRGNKRLHPIPLPKLAQRIIRGIKAVEGNPHVFAGRVRGTHLDPGSDLQAEIQKASGIADFFPHACRHTCETRWAEIGIAPHIRDLLLDHAPARGAGAGYDHHTYRREMADALELWAGHIESLVAKGAKVLR
jgi:integrase